MRSFAVLLALYTVARADEPAPEDPKDGQAQQPQPPQAQPPPPPPVPLAPPIPVESPVQMEWRVRNQLSSQMLRLEPMSFGGRQIARGDRVIGPGIFLERLNDNVRGSALAQEHATHAHIHQGFVWGMAFTGISLIAAAAFEEGLGPNDGKIFANDTARGLYIGGLFAIIFEAAFVTYQEQEIAKAVSAYNYDLVRGAIR